MKKNVLQHEQYANQRQKINGMKKWRGSVWPFFSDSSVRLRIVRGKTMNSRSIIYSTLFSFAVLACGCSQDQQEAAAFKVDAATREALIDKRAAYFKSHKDEFEAALTKCRATPKEMRDEEMTRECIAVTRAQFSG